MILAGFAPFCKKYLITEPTLLNHFCVSENLTQQYMTRIKFHSLITIPSNEPPSNCLSLPLISDPTPIF